MVRTVYATTGLVRTKIGTRVLPGGTRVRTTVLEYHTMLAALEAVRWAAAPISMVWYALPMVS